MLTQLLKFIPGLALAASLLCSASAAGLKQGDSFPDLASFKLEGKPPEAMKDKVVMVDFWASWCDPCKESFPVMEELQKHYGPQGFIIIAVNVDENRADMEDFLKKNKASFTLLRSKNRATACETAPHVLNPCRKTAPLPTPMGVLSAFYRYRCCLCLRKTGRH